MRIAWFTYVHTGVKVGWYGPLQHTVVRLLFKHIIIIIIIVSVALG